MKLALILALCLVGCTTTYDVRPIDCSRFSSQDEAQEFYEAHYEHWWTLDPERTGTACPTLK